MKSDDLDRFGRLKIFLSDEYAARRQCLLDKFNSDYPDEPSCWKYIISKLRVLGLLNCRICGSPDVIVSDDFRVLFCQDCAAESRSTAGTFFHGVRKVRAWLFSIWISEHGFYVSSKWFASAISIAQSSALHIIKSTLLAAERNFDVVASLEVPLTNLNRFFAKRTILTPALLKPSQELDESFVYDTHSQSKPNDDGRESESGKNDYTEIVDVDFEAIDMSMNAASMKDSAASSFDSEALSSSSSSSSSSPLEFEVSSAVESANECCSLDGQEENFENHRLSSVYRSLGSTPLTVDQISAITGLDWQEILAALTELEFDGLVTGLAGGSYILSNDNVDGVVLRSENFASEQSKGFDAKADAEYTRENFYISVRCFFRVILDIAHGVSRKYMSLYLACANHLVIADLDESFMEICLRTGYLGRKVLRSYIAPAFLKFAPLEVPDR